MWTTFLGITTLNSVSLLSLLSWISFRINFSCRFRISMLLFEFLHHFAMTSQRNLAKLLKITMVLPTRFLTQKLCYFAGFYNSLSSIHLDDLLSKYQVLKKNTSSVKKVMGSLQSSAIAMILRSSLEKREKVLSSWRKSLWYSIIWIMKYF